MRFSLPAHEKKRIEAVLDHAILDSPPEAASEDLAALAVRLFRVPMAFISFVDESRNWFKSKVGLNISEMPRYNSFGAHVILQSVVLVMPDARHDARFTRNALVLEGPHV